MTEQPKGERAEAAASLKLRGGIDWRRLDDEIVVLDLEGAVYYSVNASGLAVWPLLEGGATLDEMVTVISRTFGVDEPRAAADVGAFVADLRRHGLLAA